MLPDDDIEDLCDVHACFYLAPDWWMSYEPQRFRQGSGLHGPRLLRSTTGRSARMGKRIGAGWLDPCAYRNQRRHLWRWSMETIRGAWKWFVAIFLGTVAGIGLWLELRSKRNADRIIDEIIGKDAKESDDLIASGDTQGMHDKLLDKENWK